MEQCLVLQEVGLEGAPILAPVILDEEMKSLDDIAQVQDIRIGIAEIILDLDSWYFGFHLVCLVGDSVDDVAVLATPFSIFLNFPMAEKAARKKEFSVESMDASAFAVMDLGGHGSAELAVGVLFQKLDTDFGVGGVYSALLGRYPFHGFAGHQRICGAF